MSNEVADVPTVIDVPPAARHSPGAEPLRLERARPGPATQADWPTFAAGDAPAGRRSRNAVRQRGLVRAGVDGLMLLLAVLLGYPLAEIVRVWLLSEYVPISVASIGPAMLVLLLMPALVIFSCCAVKGHYVRRRPFWTETSDQLLGIAFAAASITVVLFVAKFDFSRTWTITFLAMSCLTLPVGRVLARRLLERSGCWYKPAILITDTGEAYANAVSVTAAPDLGLEPMLQLSLDDNVRIVALAQALDRHLVDAKSTGSPFGHLSERPHVIVAVEHMNSFLAAKPHFDRLMQACPVLTFLPPINGLPLYHSELMPLFRRDSVMIRLHNRLRRRSARIVKRGADLALGGITAALLLPVLLIIALLVRRDGGRAIYAQERIGECGKRFRCLKFRTMVMDADARLKDLLDNDEEAARSWKLDHKLKMDPRVTRIGEFLRQTSLDELPQLLNVLRGEMSFVGPRPIVTDEIARYATSFDYYCDARPGITGLWQVSGRNDVSYAERVRLDVWYARNWSPWLDFVILLRTVPIVLRRSGAY